MATTSKQWSYIGKGSIYIGPKGSKALRPVGNASSLEIQAEQDEKRQSDYTSPGGGAANIVQRISSVSASMTMLELSPKNLALAMRGEANEQSGGSSTTETISSATPGSFVPLDSLPDTGETITVTRTSDSTELTAGEDYIVDRAGLWLLEEPTNLSEGDELEVSYTPALQSVIQALISTGQEFRLYFNGLNEAQSGRKVAVDLHRVKFSPAESLPFIGDEFGEVQVSGEALKDPSIQATDTSPYFKVHMAHE